VEYSTAGFRFVLPRHDARIAEVLCSGAQAQCAGWALLLLRQEALVLATESVSVTPIPKESNAGDLHESAFESSSSDSLATSRVAISSSALFFAVLQSVCTAVVAINGIRFALGMGALLMNVGIGSFLFRYHQIEWLRIVMTWGAVLISSVNIGVLWQVRSLRNRAAARWRARPLKDGVLRNERLQLWLSLATLAVVAIEEYLHFRLCHTL
jgi:hypothetical protein